MFSTGSGSHDGSSYPTQWALNPSAYQNVANDQVDWAALAQQWIMMKETAPPDPQLPQAPPPTSIPSKKEVIDEGGEAPMDVDDKEENEWNSDGVGQSGQDWNWQQNWAWGGNWNGPSGVPPPNSVNNSNKSALLPTPYSHYSNQNIESNSNLDYQNPSSNEFNTGYWTNNSNNSRSKGPPNKPRAPRSKGPVLSETPRIEATTEPVTLDAAKRKQLPAWIREGLEKMEREKQKQLEKERERVEREVYLSRKKEETEGAIKLLQASGLPEKSKFDSDSEDSSSEREHRSKRSPSPARSHSPPPMSEEEKMQQKMLLVRRAMTEVLLQVTSSEIETICQEEISRFRARHSASAKKMAQYGTPSQGSISGSLGLGMYGGESDSSSEESDSDQQQFSQNNDSDSQLKETIRRRRAEFAKAEREIENRLNRDTKIVIVDKSDDAQTPDYEDSVGARDHSQVDTAQIHGSGSMKSRRYSQKSSSRTPPRKDQKTPDSQDSRKKIKKSKHSSSSSNSDSDDSSSDSTTSNSSREHRHKSRRGRSRSTETDRSRKKNHRSRSISNGTDSDDRHSRRSYRDRSYSSRRSDRSRRTDRSDRRDRSRSRSRHRSRDHSHRSRRTRSRSRSRSSRRRRSRSHRGHRSPHGGKRSRR